MPCEESLERKTEKGCNDIQSIRGEGARKDDSREAAKIGKVQLSSAHPPRERDKKRGQGRQD